MSRFQRTGRILAALLLAGLSLPEISVAQVTMRPQGGTGNSGGPSTSNSNANQGNQYLVGQNVAVQGGGVQSPPSSNTTGFNNASNRAAPLPSTVENLSLQIYDLPKEMVGSVAAQLQVLYADNLAIRVTTEPETGRLVVYAPHSAQQEIGTRIMTLQQEIARTSRSSGSEATQQRAYKLHHITPVQLEDAIKRLAGSRAIVNTIGDSSQVQLSTDRGLQEIMQIDRRAAEVFVKGTPLHVQSWMQVVTAIDGGHAESQERPTQIVPLSPADPTKVEKALKIFQASYRQDPRDQQAFGAAQLGNAQEPMDEGMAIGRIQDLNSETGLIGDVQIEFVPELGLVIVKGNKRDVQRVLEVIDKIKLQSKETQPEIEIYPLKHVDSQALAQVVSDLYTQVLEQRQGRVSITALNQPNSLLLIGQKEAIQSLRELLLKLDQPLDPNSQLRVFRMLYASARDAETTIRNFFVDQPGGNNQNTRPGLGTRVRVVADYRTNSLIVQASPRDLQEVANLIQSLDVESTPAQNEFRVFTLQNAVATDIVNVLTTAISGQSSGGGNGGGQQGGQAAGGGGIINSGDATPPSVKLQIKRAEGMIDSGILAGVVVTGITSINAVGVRAPSKSMPLIEAMIKELDQAPSAEAQIKVFEIKRGDATALATTMQQLFGLPATAGTNTSGGFLGLGAQNLAASTAGGENTLVQLRVTVDTRTNSIIASGSPRDLEVMEVLLWRLDEEGVQNRTTEVIWLRNSNASDIATAIQQFLTQQRQTINQVLFTNQAIPTEQVDREVLVQAEPSTNSLIVSASPRYAKQIREVIERLDRRPPLIMVQILLAEVELSDTFEFGTELGLQDALNFDRGTATGGTLTSTGFNVTGPLTRTITTGRPDKVAPQGLAGFGLGRTNSTLGYGGLVLSAASDTVSVLFRALQDANRIQLLSRPQVMTIDNVEAFVQVGFQVPRVTSVTNNVNAGPTIATQDTPVGLLMRLQPRTNQDGMILMNVSIERSAVGDEASGIPVGFGQNGDVIRSPIISRTLAQTRVTAFDGQTVVFAGLITKNRTSRTRRIPFLSSVPLVGPLFRFDTETERRTELLVVMTPHIVRSPEDMEMINAVESARMSWCLADILNIHGDTSLSQGNGLWGPATSPIIYPDEAPMGIDGLQMPGDSILMPADGTFPSNDFQNQNGTQMESNPPLVPAPLQIAPSIEPTSYNNSTARPNVVPASSAQPVGYPNLVRPSSATSEVR